LAALEVQRVDASKGLVGEVGDPVVEAVVGGQLVALGDEGFAFALESVGAAVDFT
jgi:hypothetical protein